MRGENECRDAGHHHAASKQGGHIIHATVKGIDFMGTLLSCQDLEGKIDTALTG